MSEKNPFQFQFLVDEGQEHLAESDFEKESYKMIKYFLASLAMPESDMWVNLSPYEKDRIIPEAFGKTEMGRDLLAQDYILKQLTSSLMHPEGELGKVFWQRIYEKAAEQGITDIPVETFNKVWIVPQTGYFYEHHNTVLLVDAQLKVMLEEDYVAAEQSNNTQSYGLDSRRPSTMTEDTKQIIREIIIPVIEKEVNEGQNFANLRQIYNAMLMAVWFKKRLKQHIFNQAYADQKKVEQLALVSGDANEKIWNQYVSAFQTGVYNVMKEEYDPSTQEIAPRRYFSGGAVALDKAESARQADAAKVLEKAGPMKTVNFAMMAEENQKAVLESWLLVNVHGFLENLSWYGSQQWQESSALLREWEGKSLDDIKWMVVAGGGNVEDILFDIEEDWKEQGYGKGKTDPTFDLAQLTDDEKEVIARYLQPMDPFHPMNLSFEFLPNEVKITTLIQYLRKKYLQPMDPFHPMNLSFEFLPKEVGGVNLRSDLADIQITEDVNGFKFPKIDPARLKVPVERMIPVIQKIAPLPKAEAMMRLGLAIPSDDQTDDANAPDKAKEIEQLSVL